MSEFRPAHAQIANGLKHRTCTKDYYRYGESC